MTQEDSQISTFRAAKRSHIQLCTLTACIFTVFNSQFPVQAQEVTIRQRSASEGVDRLIHDYAAEGDASSIELNPALLQAVKGVDLTLLGYRSISPYTRGTGFGGFLSANLGLGFAIGFGIQGLRPSFRTDVIDVEQINNINSTKISGAVSAGDGKYASVGLGFSGIRSNDRWLRTSDMDLGLMVRLFNYASLGASVRFAPIDLAQQNGITPALLLRSEVAIRPLGTRTVELAGGVNARFSDDRLVPQQSPPAAVLPRGRIALRYQGLELLGEVEQVETTVMDDQTGQILRNRRAVRGSVALGLAWDYIGIRSGIHAGLSEGVDGFGLTARFSSARQGRVYWPRRVDVERLDIAEITDQRSLLAMLMRIERARQAKDRAILLVDVRNSDVGFASLQELRAALMEIRNAGGHIFAYLEQSDFKSYYLASVAEEVYIHPAGSLDIYGLSTTTIHFKDALDKLGVKADAFHFEDFKSAHEPFTRTSPSAESRLQTEQLLSDIYAQAVYDIAKARSQSLAAVRHHIDAAPYGPEQAVQAGLVDKVVFRDQVTERISQNVGAAVDFSKFEDISAQPQTWSDKPYIAVVLIEGTIIDGESRFIPFLDLQFTGGDSIAKTLQELRNAPACKGIILRVDSPGGSALASDIISGAKVDRTREAFLQDPRHHPPIVVSMSDVAASGGYYIAMGARDIFLQTTTITGSIGAVSLTFDISGLLQKLGISTAIFKQGKNADIDSIVKPLSEEQRDRHKASLQRVYELFLKRVAAGRNHPVNAIQDLARGRVYSGKQALELGLADHTGGFYAAIAHLRKLKNIHNYRTLDVRIYPKQETLLDLILANVGSPFGYQGLSKHIKTKRQEKLAFPLALSKAVSRIPMSILFLPQSNASVIMPGLIHVE